MLSIETARAIKTGNDTTGPFTVANGANGIYINTEAEIVVTHVTAAGVETVFTDPTNYSVNGTVPSAALTLTTVANVDTGDFLVIERRSVHTQTLDLTKGGNFSGANIEEAIDALTRQVQDLRAEIDRMAALNPADTDGTGGYDLNENNLLKTGFIEFGDQSAPSTPASGYGRVYFDTSGDAVALNDAGTSTNLTDGATSAAASAATASTHATTATAAANFSTTPSLTYNYDTGTTTGCASGEVRFNNAAFASITSFFIHETSTLQGAYGDFLDTWDDSTSTIKGHARFYDPEDPDNWVILAVNAAQTDNGTDRTFPVTYIASSGSMFADGTGVHVHFDRNGDGGGIASVVNDTSPQLGGMLDVNGQAIGDGSLELITFTETGSAVNHVNVTNAAAGNGPTLGAVGDDTNIDLLLAGKGSGVPKIGANAILDAGDLADISTTNTGTSTAAAVTPDGLAGSNYGTAVVTLLVFDDATTVSTGNGAGDLFFRIPSTLNGYDLVGVAAAVQTAGTTGTTDIQIHNVTQAADMLSTVITIDSAETDSVTAAAAAVIDTANDDVATADSLRIDVDAVSTTPPQGLLVELQFRLP